MPAVPSSLIEPLWVEFAALLPGRPEYVPTHPLGCHRRRIPDRVVFEHVVRALIHGSGYERIATAACSDRTIRRRLKDWARWGLAPALHARCLAAFDKMIGLRLGDICADAAITKAPCGGEKAGKSPVDRGKMGLKRSMAVDASRVPMGVVSAPARAATCWSPPWIRRSRRSEGCPRRRASTSTAATTRRPPDGGSRI